MTVRFHSFLLGDSAAVHRPTVPGSVMWSAILGCPRANPIAVAVARLTAAALMPFTIVAAAAAGAAIVTTGSVAGAVITPAPSTALNIATATLAEETVFPVVDVLPQVTASAAGRRHQAQDGCRNDALHIVPRRGTCRFECSRFISPSRLCVQFAADNEFPRSAIGRNNRQNQENRPNRQSLSGPQTGDWTNFPSVR